MDDGEVFLWRAVTCMHQILLIMTNTTNLENGWKLEKEKEKQKTIAIPPLKKHPNN